MDTKFDFSKPVAIGGDHAGFEHKSAVIDWLTGNGYALKDFGSFSKDSVDYPDIAHPVAESVEKGEVSFGILICGSANGVAISANKHQHIRAGLSWNLEVAKIIRQHNNANIICIPARFVDKSEAISMVKAFIHTAFEAGGRHENRVNKIACM